MFPINEFLVYEIDHIIARSFGECKRENQLFFHHGYINLAFSRSFVFMVIAMLILPALLGVTGVWLATPAAELAAICLSGAMFAKYKSVYHY